MIVCLGTTPSLARTMRFDRLTVDAVNRANEVYEYAAGKAVNAARAAKTLGARVHCVGTRGGSTGGRLAALALASLGDEAVSLIPVASDSRLCVTVLDRSQGTTTELVEEAGALTPAEGEALLDRLQASLNDAQVVVLSGSLAKGLAEDFYARCIERCRSAGVLVVLDASGAPLRRAIDARPDYIKINSDELAGLVGIRDGVDESHLADAMRQIASVGIHVVVTRGVAATLFADHASVVHRFSVPKVEAMNPTGSGDSFAGGLAVGLSRGMTPTDAIRLATGCASANAQTLHAAHFSAEEAIRLAAKVEVSVLRPS